MMFTIKNKLRTENLAKAGINIDIKPERIEADSKILAKVNIDIPKAKHVMKDGLHMLTGANGEKAFVSAPNKNGFKYVMYQPKSLEEEVRRYAVTSDGMVLAEFKTPDEISQFKRNVNATLVKES